MEKNTEKNVDQAKANAKAAGENMKDAAKSAQENFKDNSLTGKQKVIMAFGMLASAATGGAVGYVVGRRKNRGDNNDTKELE